MASKESHYVSVKQEGAAGATRGKLSAATCLALGAEDGDVIEIVVKGQQIVGGGVLSAKEAKEYLREHSRGGGGSKTPAKKAKSTVSSSEGRVKSKKKAKAGKSSKRKTSVEYDEPRPKKKVKAKKGKFSLKGK